MYRQQSKGTVAERMEREASPLQQPLQRFLHRERRANPARLHSLYLVRRVDQLDSADFREGLQGGAERLWRDLSMSARLRRLDGRPGPSNPGDAGEARHQNGPHARGRSSPLHSLELRVIAHWQNWMRGFGG